MAGIPLFDAVQMILLAGVAVGLLLVRALRRRKSRPPPVSIAPDVPALAVEELIRALAELGPDLPPRQVRERVKVLLIEIERRTDEEG